MQFSDLATLAPSPAFMRLLYLIPCGKGCWFKVEVVDGRTPFLVSNAFLRKLECQLDFARTVLRIPKWQREIELRVNSKGIYMVDIGELIEGTDPPATVQSQQLLQSKKPYPLKSNGIHGRPRERSRSRAPCPRGPRPGPGSGLVRPGDQQASGGAQSQTVGPVQARGERAFIEVYSFLSILSFPNFFKSHEHAWRQKPRDPWKTQDETGQPTTSREVLMTQGKMKTEQLPFIPQQPSSSQSGSKRTTSWEMVNNAETETGMSTELVPERAQELRMQRELDQNAKS